MHRLIPILLILSGCTRLPKGTVYQIETYEANRTRFVLEFETKSEDDERFIERALILLVERR